MAPRLWERLAARDEALMGKAIAESLSTSGTSASSIDAQSLPLSLSNAPQASAGFNDTSQAKRNRVDIMTEAGDVLSAESEVMMEDSISPASSITMQSSATSVSEMDLVANPARRPVDSELIDNATSHTSIEQSLAGAQTNQLSQPPSQLGEESNEPYNATPNPSHTVSNDVTSMPESTPCAKKESIQKTRTVPTRATAAKAAGCYAFGDGVADDASRAQNSVVASTQTSAKRKRVDVDAGDGRRFQNTCSSRSNHKNVAAPISQKNVPRMSERSKRVAVQTVTRDVGLMEPPPAVQIFNDDDDKDEDYSPRNLSRSGKKADVKSRQFSLHRWEELGLSIKHIKETQKVFAETVPGVDSAPTLKRTRKATKKETYTSVTHKSLQSKQTAKQRKVTRAKESSSHLPILPEMLTKNRTIVRTTGSFTNKYKIRFGYTPFPQNTRPSRKTCHEVFDALKRHHERDDIMLERYPIKKENSINNVQGPMHAAVEVNFHNIVKSVLSQATNNDNAQTVEQTLINRFRYDFLGLKVKGQSPNYHAMRKLGEPAIARALVSGGLHNIKAKQILGCLNHVYDWNMARATKEQQIEAQYMRESADFVPGMLSIDYMTTMSLQEKFDHLVSMPGIGVKTAACILSFNFEYPVFAVDTHVFRLSRMLRWLPLNARHENYVFMHLDKRIPDELKYGLHQAFWHHGQTCIRCKKGTDENTKGWKETSCPIDRFVDRARKDPATTKRPKLERDENGEELKKVKMRPHVFPHSKLTPEQAAELGYELRTIMIDDGFGVRRANFKSKPLLKWVLKSDHAAIEDTDRPATTEDIKNEVEDSAGMDKNLLFPGADKLAASAEDILGDDDSELSELDDWADEDVVLSPLTKMPALEPI